MGYKESVIELPDRRGPSTRPENRGIHGTRRGHRHHLPRFHSIRGRASSLTDALENQQASQINNDRATEASLSSRVIRRATTGGELAVQTSHEAPTYSSDQAIAIVTFSNTEHGNAVQLTRAVTGSEDQDGRSSGTNKRRRHTDANRASGLPLSDGGRNDGGSGTGIPRGAAGEFEDGEPVPVELLIHEAYVAKPIIKGNRKEYGTVKDQATALLRDVILGLTSGRRLPFGTRLPSIKNIHKLIHVDENTLKEILNNLDQRERIIEVRPKRRAIVTDPTEREGDILFEQKPPLYKELAELLEYDLRRGEYLKGNPLPFTMNEIAGAFGFSEVVVRRAYSELIGKGLLVHPLPRKYLVNSTFPPQDIEPQAEIELPKYKQIAEFWRRRIRTGEVRPRDRIPSEDDLAEMHGVDKKTINNAVGELKIEGLVVARIGIGTFVADEPLPEVGTRVLPPTELALQYEILVADLEDRIQRGEIGVGDLLTEDWLMEDSGFGRYTVRAAVARLRRHGYVEISKIPGTERTRVSMVVRNSPIEQENG